MAKKEGYSVEGLFGTITHYDSKGHKIGESVPSIWGGYNNYDSKGHKTGETRPSFLGYTSYDAKGHKTGSSVQGFLGTTHYDAKGHKTGTTTPGFLGSTTYGNGSSSADIAGMASAAAALERESATAIGIAAAVSATESEPERPVRRRESVSPPQPKAAPEASPTPRQEEKQPAIFRYIIVKVPVSGKPSETKKRYYRCSEEVRVGDLAVVPDAEAPVRVLAVVESETFAAPCSPAVMKKVLAIKK